jgi:hypothetical protein
MQLVNLEIPKICHWNAKYVYSYKDNLIFFIYPGPMGCEEASSRRAGRARRSQNQFAPLGGGVKEENQ